jgi:integrase/recombinase XerD
MDQIELIEEFKADLKTRGLSADSLRTYPGYVIDIFKFNHGDLLGVNEEILSKYLEHLRANHLKRTSIDRHFSALNTCYKFLIFKKYISVNPVASVREHYLRKYKSHDASQRRQCITVDQAATLVNSIHDTRDKAIVVLLLKTGIRRKELSELDFRDVDMTNKVITLKPTAKRSNETVYFDDEAVYVLNRWLRRREQINIKNNRALFIDRYGNRISLDAINLLFKKHAISAGLHDPDSDRLQERLSPHSCRHWFTTRLFEAGCPREYIQELRGDVGRDAIDIYTHIDKKKLQQAYEDCIPKLGII